MSFSSAVGVVHLRDLRSRHAWHEPELPRLLELYGVELEGRETATFEPPGELLLICPIGQVEVLPQHRCWLGQTSRLHVLLSYRDCPEAREDTELGTFLEEEARRCLRGLPLASLERFWDDGSLEEAPLELFGLLDKPLAPEPPTLLTSRAPYVAGPWLQLPPPPFMEPETYWPSLVCVRKGRVSVFVPELSSFLSLSDGSLEKVEAGSDLVWAAAWPDGSRLLFSNHQGEFRVVDLESGQVRTSRGPYGRPVGLWPGGRIGWSGARCTFSWLSLGEGEVGLLAACEHDWPCGHEKKQYGFLDNEPCWVHLSRLNDAYLSVYQKDAIVSSAVPLRWRRCEGGWAAVGRPCADFGRALFFGSEGNWVEGDPTDPDASDLRDFRPVIVLGPDPGARYALDHSRAVYRLTNTESVLVRSPEESYGIYNARHELVRLASGRLLGGWDRALTVLEGGRLRRDDILSGKSIDLGSEEEPVSWAFSVPGTPNVVLVAGEGKDDTRVRLV